MEFHTNIERVDVMEMCNASEKRNVINVRLTKNEIEEMVMRKYKKNNVHPKKGDKYETSKI